MGAMSSLLRQYALINAYHFLFVCLLDVIIIVSTIYPLLASTNPRAMSHEQIKWNKSGPEGFSIDKANQEVSPAKVQDSKLFGPDMHCRALQDDCQPTT